MTRPDDIAVIGLGCLFPGAPDVATFWRNILAKVDAISDPPPEAWDPSLYYEAGAESNDRLYCRKGGYLGALAEFDPLDHGIMPRAVEGGEPDQWLALHVARQALRDAGCEDVSAYRDRAALILGKGTYANRGTLSMVQHAMLVDYTLGILKSIHPTLSAGDLADIRRDLKQRLPRFDAETAPALIPNVTVGRIANRLDLMGPSYTVDAACASSLVAIDIAVKGLRQDEYDLAIVGGIQVATPHPVLGLFCQLNALSPSERIRPFDKNADGTLLSEGLGMAVLKRRSLAERDGDRIYAVIRGTGVASDGRAVGVLAPRVEGEELALRRAYEHAGVAPESVGLIEAHGTGTLVGDAVEVEALGRVFGGRAGVPRCALGSVKSMIGHTMPAAGMAGFIKSVLALHYKVLPPTINVDEPSPRLGLEKTPFYINTETRPWIHGHPVHPRRAGVNSFGFGGINAHVVLEEASTAPSPAADEVPWDSEVCLFAGDSRADVIALGRLLREAIGRDPSAPLPGIARALNLRPQQGRLTLGIVAQSTADLDRKLEKAIGRIADPACRRIKDASGIYFFDDPLAARGSLAFLFPGEGSQYVNMLADLCRHLPTVRACFDQVDRMFASHPRGYVLSDFLYPPPPGTTGAPPRETNGLFQMDIAVEAVLTANHALHSLLTELGIRPDALLGHSTGEFSALRAAGMLDDRDERWTTDINKLYLVAVDDDRVPVQVDLLAVGAARERVGALAEAFGDAVVVAMDNCLHQTVVAVRRDVSAAVQARCRAEGLLYELLPFDRPYHTALFDVFAQGMHDFFRRWITRPPATPLYSCTTVGPYPAALEEARTIALEHWIRPVEFRQTIERMYADGVRLFVEVGPRGNLTAFVDDVLGRREYAAVPANVARRSGVAQLHHLIAHLSAHGVRPALAPLYGHRRIAAFDWTAAQPPARVKRTLGPMKIPTGAAAMSLSPEIIERIRSHGGVKPGPAVSRAESAPAAVAPSPAPEPPPSPVDAVDPAAPPDLADASLESLAAPAGSGTNGQASPGDVMGAYLGAMEKFLALEHDFVHAALGAPAASAVVTAAAVETPAPRPFIDAIVSMSPGASLVARCTIDLDKYPFLRDHTLGRHVSSVDPELPGLPIVPFTALMEMMAQGAMALTPARTLIGMTDVRVSRWIALDEGPLTLEIHAEVTGDGRTRVRILDTGSPVFGQVAEGVMLTGDRHPDAPSPAALAIPDAAPFKFPPERLYETAMFHGPAFRGVRSIDEVGAAGASATLAAGHPPATGRGAAGAWVTDLVLLDQPGQVVGFWAAQQLDRSFFVLPMRMQSLQLYGPPLAAGEIVTCRARIVPRGDHELTSTLDVVRRDGRLWARFEGWDDRRFELPGIAHQMLVRPDATRLAQPWPLPGARNGDLAAFRIGIDTFPPGWLNAHGGLWRRVIASLVLSRAEREIWRTSRMPDSRRLEWLFGRIAAKDAVREYLSRHGIAGIRPADVEILPDASGQPRAGGAWTARIPSPPHISISHVAGSAVAIAGAADATAGVGIDLERRGRMTLSMEDIAFSPDERAMLHAFDGEEREAWAVRLWCAKEAFAKSTGCVVGPTSRALAVQQIDREQGTVLLRYMPAGEAGITLSASTAQEGDWVVATCTAAHAPEAIEGARS